MGCAKVLGAGGVWLSLGQQGLKSESGRRTMVLEKIEIEGWLFKRRRSKTALGTEKNMLLLTTNGEWLTVC